MDQGNNDSNAVKLSILLSLQQRAIKAPLEELPFIIVNETVQLVNYRQAVLWKVNQGEKISVMAVSGVAVPEKNSPMIQWLDSSGEFFLNKDKESSALKITKADLPDKLAKPWDEWFPEYGLLLKFFDKDKNCIALLGLFRSDPEWSDAESHVLSFLVDTYTQSLLVSEYLCGKRKKISLFDDKKKLNIFIIIAFIFCILLIPIRESALSPGVVVSSNPFMVRSPLHGVIDDFFIEPNDIVKKDQPLLKLDDTELKSRLAVAAKGYEIARAEYIQASQQAIYDANAKSKITILETRMEQQITEVNYLNDLLERVELKSPVHGVAIFDEPDDWIGRPVRIGETILIVSKPKDILLEISIPAEDAVNLSKGAEVLFFLNTAPMKPVKAEIIFSSYNALPNPRGYMAYRVEAEFKQDSPKLKIGMMGTAKVYGNSRPIIMILFKKPFNLVRQWLGV